MFWGFLIFPLSAVYGVDLTQENAVQLSKTARRLAFAELFQRERGKTVIAPLTLLEFTYADWLDQFGISFLESLTEEAKQVVEKVQAGSFSSPLKKSFFEATRRAYRFEGMENIPSFFELYTYLQEKKRGLRWLAEAVSLFRKARRWDIAEEDLQRILEPEKRGDLVALLASVFTPSCREKSRAWQPPPHFGTLTLRLKEGLIVVYGEPQKLAQFKRKLSSHPVQSEEELVKELQKASLAFERFSKQRGGTQEAYFGTLRQGFLQGAIPPLVGLSKEKLLSQLNCLGFTVEFAPLKTLEALASQEIPACHFYFTGTEPSDLVYAAPCP